MADPANAQTTAVTRRQETHVDALSAYLKKRESNLATYAKNSVKTETLIRLAVYESSKQGWMKTASPESVYASLIIAAQLGLEPSGARGEAYLVPFKGVCSLMPGYRGLIKLAMRSGAVKSIRSRIVYAGDDFVVKYGTEESIHHEPMVGRELAEDTKGNPVEPQLIAAYAVAVMTDGGCQFEVMDGWQLDKVRNASAQPNGDAWTKWRDEMYRKAPIRRLAKYLPLGDDYFAKAVRLDEAHDSGKVEEVTATFIDADSTEIERPVEQSRIEKAAERAK